LRRNDLYCERAWEEDHTTPLAALGEAMAREAINGSGKIEREHAKIDAARQRLRDAGADADTLDAIDAAVWALHSYIEDLAARVGVEVGRHVQPEALYQQVLRETGVWQDYDIPLGAPAKQVTP
jgi:hypothetical protein